MDVDVYPGLLAVITDARPGRRCLSSLVPAFPQWKTERTNSRAGAASGFTIFVAFGHTGESTQTRRKRIWSLERLPPGPQSTLSGDPKGQNRAKTSPGKPIIAVLVTASVVKVQGFYERYLCVQFGISKLKSINTK